MIEKHFPKTWAIVKSSDFVIDPKSDIVDGPFGSSLKASEYIDSGVPIVRIQNVKRFNFIDKNIKFVSKEKYEELQRHNFINGDILITKLGDPLGLACEVPEKYRFGIIISDLIRLRPNLQICSKSFLIYLLNSEIVIKQIEKHVKGTTRPRINLGVVRGLTLPLPPLAEQKIIADKLDTLLAQVEATQVRLQSIPAILKAFRQSVLFSAVTGKLTEEWRVKNPTKPVNLYVEKHNANKKGFLKVRGKTGWDSASNLFDLPPNWAWIENYKLARDESNAICAGPFGTIFKAKDFRDEGIPIIFLRHVKESGFNQNKPTFMDRDVWKKWHQDYSVFGGELLVTKLGDPPGECCIFPEGIGVAMVTPDVLKMHVDTEVADKEYLKHFFNSPASKKMVAASAFGVTRLRIDMSLFKLFPIPLPPIEEQCEIVRQIEELFVLADCIEQKSNAALERVNNLTQSILVKAFRGELTTDWRDANPELISGNNSAESLLKKIKTEREAIKKQPKLKLTTVKQKTGSLMSKPIIKVVEALEQAGEPLSGQQLLIAAGYPSDSNTEQLEQFFLDIRNALSIEKSIVKLERDLGSQDWFTLVKDTQ